VTEQSSNGHHPASHPAHATHTEIERVTALAETASEQTLSSYEATCQEMAAFLRTLKKLEREGQRIPARDRVKLWHLRDIYLESMAAAFRQGRIVMREYLRLATGTKGDV